MRVWVTRCKDIDRVFITKGSKPKLRDRNVVTIPVLMLHIELCAVGFKNLFGYTPRKGSCKLRDLSLKDIDL